MGAPCPVYVTRETWRLLDSYPIAERRLVNERDPIEIGPMRFGAFAVEHSLRAPAVGYRASPASGFPFISRCGRNPLAQRRLDPWSLWATNERSLM